jgi:integrase
MAIYKRGKFYSYSFTYRGRRIQKSTRQGDKEEAKKLMAAERTRLARIDAGLEAPEPRPRQQFISIGALLERVEQRYRLEGRASPQNLSTLAVARRAFGARMATNLTSECVDDYIRRRLAQGARNASINRVTELLRRAYRLAKLEAPQIRHLSEKDNVRRGFFTAAEFSLVVEKLPDDLKDFCRFAFLTGWRRNEVRSLTWNDIQSDTVYLRAANSKNREPRSVPISGELIELMERRKQARAVQTKAGVVLAAHVFHRSGEPIGEFRRSWRTACRLAGVPGRLFHDLRRSAVRDMIRSGVAQSVVMEISGHKTVSMFKRYNITDERDKAAAFERLGEYHETAAKKLVPLAVQ